VREAVVSDQNSDEAALGGEETILLVEDEEAVRRIAKLTLETYGYKVLEAPEADTAKALFGKSSEIDMVVSDVIMPGINGRELTEHFRALRPDIKVLYISGYTDDAVLARGVSESKDAFLQKPFLASGHRPGRSHCSRQLTAGNAILQVPAVLILLGTGPSAPSACPLARWRRWAYPRRG
jgi:CheY-like chemotaxis protein